MNWQMIGAIGEVVGALAVVLTLFYLARQVREASREARRDRWSKLSSEFSGWSDGFASDKEFSNIMFRGFRDISTLEPVEVFRLYASLFRFFRAWEALFECSREGGVHQEGAEALGRTTTDLLGFPGIQVYWAERCHWFTSAFRIHVDGLLKNAGPDLAASYDRANEVDGQPPGGTA